MEQYKINQEKISVCLGMLENKQEVIEHCIIILEKEIKEETNKSEENLSYYFNTKSLKKLKWYKEIEDSKKKSA